MSSSSSSRAARTPSPGPTPARSTPPCWTSCAANPGHPGAGRTARGRPGPPPTQAITHIGDTMSNHFSADNLKFPGDDRRLDLTEVFVFQAPASPEQHHTLLHRHHPGTTVLIMDSNPTSAPPPIPAPVTGPEFCPGAVYRINIDTDGDNHADVAVTFVFSEYENGRQIGTAKYVAGAQARQPEQAGEVLSTDIPVSFDG